MTPRASPPGSRSCLCLSSSHGMSVDCIRQPRSPTVLYSAIVRDHSPAGPGALSASWLSPRNPADVCDLPKAPDIQLAHSVLTSVPVDYKGPQTAGSLSALPGMCNGIQAHPDECIECCIQVWIRSGRWQGGIRSKFAWPQSAPAQDAAGGRAVTGTHCPRRRGCSTDPSKSRADKDRRSLCGTGCSRSSEGT